MHTTRLDELTDRAAALVTPDRRALLGIAGAPGAGKTTFALALVDALRERGLTVAHVPMDGFHLADVALRERGLLEVKGAVGTFDAHGYLALLQRLRADLAHEVLAPAFERTLEQPLAGALAVAPDVSLVVTEGNYLLDADDPWPAVREALDEVWFAEVPDDVRVRRLVERHVQFGKSAAAAADWVADVDEVNTRRVVARRRLADLVVEVG